MMTHEGHAISTGEFVDFLTDALIDSTGPDWTCSDGAWAIVRRLATEGCLAGMLNLFEQRAESFRVGPSIYKEMAATIELKDAHGVDGWRTVATCWSFTDARFLVSKLNAIAAATGTAETGETQAQCEASQSGAESASPKLYRGIPHE
jgi:hypothetical protein